MSKHISVSARNARLTLFVAFLSDLAFILPIWLLFGTDQLGFSTTLATALFMTLWLTSGLLEVPTGALADRLGRKKMFLVGSALMILYPFAYIFEMPIGIIFAVSIVSGLGSALSSGTLLALTNDAFKKDHRSEKEYHNFLSNEKVAVFSARALSGVLGGVLYAYDPHAPFVAMALTYGLIFATGFFIVDTSTDRSTLSNRAHIADTVRSMWSVPLIMTLITFYIAFQSVGEAVWTAYQPFFAGDGISSQGIGLIFSCIALISALGAYATRHFMRRYGVMLIELFVCGTFVVTTGMLLVPFVWVHVLAVVPAAFGFGVSITPIVATTQKFIRQQLHSTALSIVSFVQYVTYGIASLYVSGLIDSLGTSQTRAVLFVQVLVVMVAASGYYLTHKERDEIVTPKEQEGLADIPVAA